MKTFLTLKGSIGCVSGISIYLVAKAAARIANIFVRRHELNSDTKNIMRPLFPYLDLERIRIKSGSTLPPNWFRRRAKFVAITFGYTIYCTGIEMQSTNMSLNVIMHELVHAEQIRKRDNSEMKFASDYGKGYLHTGNYRQNPLEEEAFDFVNLHHLI
jgi:hypothetical protein